MIRVGGKTRRSMTAPTMPSAMLPAPRSPRSYSRFIRPPHPVDVSLARASPQLKRSGNGPAQSEAYCTARRWEQQWIRKRHSIRSARWARQPIGQPVADLMTVDPWDWTVKDSLAPRSGDRDLCQALVRVPPSPSNVEAIACALRSRVRELTTAPRQVAGVSARRGDTAPGGAAALSRSGIP